MTISTTSLKFSFQRLRWTLSGLWRRLILCRREVWTVITSTISIQYLQRSLKRQMVVYIEILYKNISKVSTAQTKDPMSSQTRWVWGPHNTNDNVIIVTGIFLRKCTFLILCQPNSYFCIEVWNAVLQARQEEKRGASISQHYRSCLIISWNRVNRAHQFLKTWLSVSKNKALRWSWKSF